MVANQKLRDLDAVERSALAHIIGDDPQVQSARVGNILADPADKHRIFMRRLGYRGRVAAILALVHDLHSRSLGQ